MRTAGPHGRLPNGAEAAGEEVALLANGELRLLMEFNLVATDRESEG